MLTVIHLISPNTPAGLTTELQRLGVFVTDIPASRPIPQMCRELIAVDIHSPMVFIATDSGCRDLPALALAQAAAHRSVISYALIDPDYPVSTDTWPNAPVNAYVTSPESSGSRTISLRGVEVQQFITVTELAHMIKAQVDTAQ